MEENRIKSYKKFYLLLVPAALFFGFAGYWQITSTQGRNLEFETETVKEDTLEVKVPGSGTIIASEKKDIKSEISGVVEEVLINTGDKVEKDQELLKIKNDELDATKAERWAEYLKAVDDLEKVYVNPDAPESEKKSGEANRDSAKLNHQLAEDAVNKKIIKAPITGTIVNLDVKVGDIIDVSEEIKNDSIIMTILNLDKLEAQVAIDEKDLPKISISQAATLSLEALKDNTLKGAVADIDSFGIKQNGLVTYNVNIFIEDLENNNIKPGMSVNALININKEKNILLVPNDALRLEGERYYVEVLKNNEPQKRVIKVGLSNEKYTQVLDGLKLGEEVVVGMTEKNMESNILKAIKNF